MATVFEIVDKLRAGETVIIPSNYSLTFMSQIEVHSDKIGDLRPVQVITKNKAAYLTLA